MIYTVPNMDVPHIGPSKETIVPDVHPGDNYIFQCHVDTRAGHTHAQGTTLRVIDFTQSTPHNEISESGRNWICQSLYGTSVWATLEQCISRGLLVKSSAIHATALYVRNVDDDYEVTVNPMTFDKARLCYGPRGAMHYDDGFCYADPALAIEAGKVWNGKGDPLDGWHRQPSTGRRRPGGDPKKEVRYW